MSVPNVNMSRTDRHMLVSGNNRAVQKKENNIINLECLLKSRFQYEFIIFKGIWHFYSEI